MTLRPAFLLALVALAACEEAAGTVPTARGDLPAAAVEAAMPPMGSARLDLGDAVRAFRSTCLDTLPRFAGAADALRGQGLAENPATGTWYDPRRELSVNLDPQEGRPVCSMVFASAEDPTRLGVALAFESAARAAAGTPSLFETPSGGVATPLAGGGRITFQPRIGGRPDLHRAVIVAGR